MIVYGSSTCSPCSSLKKYLDHKGVTYTYLDIDEDPVHAAMVMSLTGQRIVPVAVKEGHIPVVGLNYSAISKLISADQ